MNQRQPEPYLKVKTSTDETLIALFWIRNFAITQLVFFLVYRHTLSEVYVEENLKNLDWNLTQSDPKFKVCLCLLSPLSQKFILDLSVICFSSEVTLILNIFEYFTQGCFECFLCKMPTLWVLFASRNDTDPLSSTKYFLTFSSRTEYYFQHLLFFHRIKLVNRGHRFFFLIEIIILFFNIMYHFIVIYIFQF